MLLEMAAVVLLVALWVALGVDRWLGEPPVRYHPVVWMGHYLGWAGRWVQRVARQGVAFTHQGQAGYADGKGDGDQQKFESRPDAIRAIPWTRALLAGGLHSELIGVGQFAPAPATQLSKAFNEDESFHTYVKGMAYAIARTDLKCAWLTLTGSIPEKAHILALAQALKTEAVSTAEQLLASLHLEVIEGKRFVFKATTGIEPADPWKIKENSLLNLWPSLKAEVYRKEKNLRIYRLFLIYAKSNPAFIQSSSLNDFYSGFLAAVSTDAGLVDPASAHHFTW